MSRNRLALLLFVLLGLAVGGVGGAVTATSIESWYPQLRKPWWTPPPAVFGPVWTTLYVMIGIAGWLVWRSGRSDARRAALALWGGQLALNLIWSPLFFGMRAPGLAAFDIAALWILLVIFIGRARRVSKPAAWLFIPYYLWVSFATALNLSIWWLNRGGPA